MQSEIEKSENRRILHRGFTLVELLVVVVILVTLMTIVFRIGNIGDESEKRAITIDRMQRLENAISGYYAAFGMYPPVRLHGSRNIYLRVDEFGLQSDDGDENESIWGWVNSTGTKVENSDREYTAWSQVKAACESQPVACEFPFASEHEEEVKAGSEALQAWAEQSEVMTEEQKSVCSAGFDDGVTENIGRHRRHINEIEWSEVQLFKFGLMSYLLPRYLVMMNGDEEFFTKYAQWTGNNTAPSDPINGQPMSWEDVHRYSNNTQNRTDVMRVSNVPSQAVCARWMANFEKALTCNFAWNIFGISIKDDTTDAATIPRWNEGESSGYLGGHIYNPNGYGGGSSDNYTLDCITMKDGWNNDLYYYSPAPYQSYTVWSAGSNGRTFPPWISREKLSADANRCVSYWTKDDIVGLKN